MTNKKELKIKGEGNLYKLYWENGGEVPKALSGLYTSRHEALHAASIYLQSRDGVGNAKGKSREK